MTDMEVVTTTEFGPEVQLVTMFDTSKSSLFSLSTTHAGADTTFHKDSREYGIDLIRVPVENRRQGFGREMLGVIVAHARSLQAEAIVCSIISREGLALAVSVVDEESVTVVMPGEFAAEGEERNEAYPADASLRIEL